ncbi:galactokinase [Microbacterium schleiferi]|uniref:galactokinase n=1 Tax=Microbacterium schleiferi TaxID=69362 RepID=UPI00311DD31A
MTDAAPLGVWSAPGRVNLIGEHTDYNDGFVLPFAIDARTAVAVAARTDGVLRVRSSFDESGASVAIAELDALFETPAPASVPEWTTYPLGVAWALLHAAGETANPQGLDLAIASSVPVGAGLSSSAAIECAVAVALNELWGTGLGAKDLARVGRTAENEAVGAPTGIMDQTASMLGEADAAVFLDCRTLETEVVPLGLEAADLEVLVIDTLVTHAHSTGGYRERRASCEQGAAAMDVAMLRDLTPVDLERAASVMDEVTLRRVRHVVTENARVLETVRVLRESGPRAIGELLLASHASMRDDFEISVPELDTAVEAAMSGGAIGARMTGGGFGGAAIALVPRDRLDAVTDAVTAAFSASDFRTPRIFTVQPSAGAHRDS